MEGFAGRGLGLVAGVALVACGGGGSPGGGSPADSGGEDAARTDGPADAPGDAAVPADTGADAREAGSAPEGGHDAGEAGVDAGVHDASVGSDGGPLGPVPFPQVSLHGGPVMTGIKLVSVVASNDTAGSALLAFGDALIASQWWTTVSAPYGTGAIQSHTKVTGGALTANPTIDAIQSYLRASLTAQSLPAPDPSSLYVLYLPDGVWAVDPSSGQPNTNCSSFGGYHYYDVNDTSFVWAVVQQCPMGGGIPGLSTTLQAATHVASHEILEAATEPLAANGYSLDCGSDAPPSCTPWVYVPAFPGEVGDLCAWTMTMEGGYAYTRAWSNAAAASGGDPCVPAGTSAYVSATTTQAWFTAQPGQTVQIPVTGWAPATAAPWQAYAYAAYDPKSQFTVTPTTWVPLGVGQTASVSVTAPAGAVSGDFVVVDVASYTATEIHPWPVGVYVP